MYRSVLTRFGVFCLAALAPPTLAQPVPGDCTPNTVTVEVDRCPKLGDELVATIVLTNANEAISGGQFFLEYSVSVFDVVLVAPGGYPFNGQLYSDVDPALGLIAYAVITSDGSGTMEDTVMVTMTFQVVGDAGGPFIRFRDEHPQTNRLLLARVGALFPHTVNAGQTEPVNLTHVAAFQNCFTGAGEEVAPSPECRCAFDHDHDRDVDLADYEHLHAAMSGALPWTCSIGSR